MSWRKPSCFASCTSRSVKVTLGSIRTHHSKLLQLWPPQAFLHGDISHKNSSLPVHSFHHIPINTYLLTNFTLRKKKNLKKNIESYPQFSDLSYFLLTAIIRNQKKQPSPLKCPKPTIPSQAWSTLSSSQGWAKQLQPPSSRHTGPTTPAAPIGLAKAAPKRISDQGSLPG